jgi:hypothetical protein
MGPTIPATLIAATSDFVWSAAIVQYFSATDYTFEAIGTTVPSSIPIVANGTYDTTHGLIFNFFEQRSIFPPTLLYGSDVYNSAPMIWEYRNGSLALSPTAKLYLETGPQQIDGVGWVDYGPTGTNTFVWSGATTNPTLGNSTVSARYHYLNAHTVTVAIHIVVGAVGFAAGAGVYGFSLPVPMRDSTMGIGAWYIFDNGIANRCGSAIGLSASVLNLHFNASAVAVGSATQTWNNPDEIRISVTYEV